MKKDYYEFKVCGNLLILNNRRVAEGYFIWLKENKVDAEFHYWWGWASISNTLQHETI